MPMPRSRAPARLVLTLCAGFILLAIAAGAARAADRERLEAFLEVTGFGVALDSIALAAADAPAMLGLTTSDFGADWARVAGEVFDTERMRTMGLDILAGTLSDEMLGHAAEFYASELGQRLVEVENASHLHEDDAARRAEGEALLAEMETGRIEVLENMREAIDSADTGVRAVQEIQLRFLLAASYAGVLGYEVDEDALRSVLAQGEDSLREALDAAALANSAYTYQALSTEDLRAYVDALEHPVMQQVYELMNAVQYEIMANRFEVLAVRMAEMHPVQEL
ncbi:hypothetical protein SAMN05443999_1125 [Roseovarius azorensis]|uniref:DUF2059 domain-containing protein n=1 Tax=Roseovarius azorensis TaxID=1287727 RepID=A0A1H7V9I7_9RHOB|nr:DUF2059 domain-containing protein [Roseovarius azorensis]SEM05535.1 hypothetical protein SAMN05443999_1125 [Roseovarius azorensis]